MVSKTSLKNLMQMNMMVSTRPNSLNRINLKRFKNKRERFLKELVLVFQAKFQKRKITINNKRQVEMHCKKKIVELKDG